VKSGLNENPALTTPLSYTGTAEELDAELGKQLASYVECHLVLGSTLASAKAEMDAAARAAQEEARSETEDIRGHPESLGAPLAELHTEGPGVCGRIFRTTRRVAFSIRGEKPMHIRFVIDVTCEDLTCEDLEPSRVVPRIEGEIFDFVGEEEVMVGRIGAYLVQAGRALNEEESLFDAMIPSTSPSMTATVPYSIQKTMMNGAPRSWRSTATKFLRRTSFILRASI
jgi:PRTRC genetic system protein E